MCNNIYNVYVFIFIFDSIPIYLLYYFYSKSGLGYAEKSNEKKHNENNFNLSKLINPKKRKDDNIKELNSFNNNLIHGIIEDDDDLEVSRTTLGLKKNSQQKINSINNHKSNKAILSNDKALSKPNDNTLSLPHNEKLKLKCP